LRAFSTSSAPLSPFIKFRHFESTTDAVIAVFEFVNPTERTIYYYGYSVEWPQTWVQLRFGDVWKDACWDWCGTGMEVHELGPGRSVNVSISLEEDAEELWYEELDNPGPLREVAERIEGVLLQALFNDTRYLTGSFFAPKLKSIAEHGCPIRVGTYFGRSQDDLNTRVWSASIEVPPRLAMVKDR
jgi:hypothetical protein